MTSIKIDYNDLKELSQSEFDFLMLNETSRSSRISRVTRWKAVSGKRVAQKTLQILDEDVPSNHRHKRSIVTIILSGFLTVGIAFGLLYSQHGQGSPSGQTSTDAPNTSRVQVVYAVSGNDTLLPPGVATLKYSEITSMNRTAKIVSPSWTPAPKSRGSVTQGGDIAVIDGTAASSHLNLQLEVENLRALSSDYSSFSFPIDIYRCNPDRGACGSNVNPWQPYKTAATDQQRFVSNTAGGLSYQLPHGYLYDVTMDAGQGTYQTTSIPRPTTGSLAPAFMISASIA